MGATKVAIAAATALLLAATPAAAAGREPITIDLPSDGNVDASQVRFNGADHPKRLIATVLLPEGYDPARRYPVLYLLHGAGENYRSWVDKTKAEPVTRDLDAIVVMPDAATGFYLNHFNGGRRGSPGWERYFLDEVIPAVERRFPIRPGRRWHAVAGFSMGGFGAAYLASQRPDYFGASAPMSGFLAPRRPEIPVVFDAATGQSYAQFFGPPDGAYAAGHDPVALGANLQHTRLFVISGNGVPDPSVAPQQSFATDVAGEAALMFHGSDFAAAGRAAGADVTHTVLLGTHNHPYWNLHLRLMLAWDPFGRVAEAPRHWTYDTVADRGRAWELTYRFEEPPEVVQRLERVGDAYAGRGSGTVEVCDADGRGFRARLPFAARRPERSVALRVLGRRAGALRVEVRAAEPQRVRVGGARLATETVDLAAGERRTVALRLRGGARGRLRVVARYGDCPGGRWTTAAAPAR